MEHAERLRLSRDALLKLHKSLLDRERVIYEGLYGPVSAGHFLNLLLDDREFAWLRRFSSLIVEIDEMFDQADGFSDDKVLLYISRMRRLITMEAEDEEFLTMYRAALQSDIDAATYQGVLNELLS